MLLTKRIVPIIFVVRKPADYVHVRTTMAQTRLRNLIKGLVILQDGCI